MNYFLNNFKDVIENIFKYNIQLHRNICTMWSKNIQIIVLHIERGE